MTKNKGMGDEFNVNRNFKSPIYYILKHRTPIVCTNKKMIFKSCAYKKRRVRRTFFSTGDYVSTIFLMIDHSYLDDKLHLFETMIYRDGGFIDYVTRCSTWRQALRMHWKAVKVCKRLSYVKKKGEKNDSRTRSAAESE